MDRDERHRRRRPDDSRPGQGSFLEAPLPSHAGHRQRLKDRFLAGGRSAIADYELLELVLFNAIPQRDTKELAKALLARFGSFAAVINAPEPRLREIKGVKDAVVTQFRLLQVATLELKRAEVIEKPVLSSWNACARLLQGGDGARDARAVPHPVPRQARTASSPTRCRARARSITRRSTCARWSSARSSCRPPPSSWCTTTPRATRRRRAPTST